MSISYGPLSPLYDRLTEDVDYSCFADYYEGLFAENGGEFRLLLDLCCGTGTLTWEMAGRGYELIGVDGSEDMLMEAQSKSADCEKAPLFICQDAAELDLYGTVDGAYSSLDSINYISPDALESVFHRLQYFVRPGGLLVFDIRTPEWLKSMDRYVSVDEDEDMFCVWRADYSDEEACLVYGMDLFERQGKSWKRFQEEHVEYAHSEDYLRSVLESNFFTDVCFSAAPLKLGEGRVFVTARRV